MPENFESKKCIKSIPDDQEAFEPLWKEARDQVEKDASGGLVRPLQGRGIRLGEGAHVAKFYRDLKDQLTPQQYLKYLSGFVESPEDVWRVVDSLKWVPNGGRQDILKEPHKTLTEGGGDCDNLALVAKTLLEELGCRDGYNYHPRIIGNRAGMHAVCIFTGKDKKSYVFDEKKMITEFPKDDIYQASDKFRKPVDGDEDQIYEEFLGPDGKFRVQTPLDDKTLKSRGGIISLQIFNVNYDQEGFNIKEHVPVSFLRGKTVAVHFADRTIVFYKSGKLFQETYPEGIQFIYMGSKVRKEYPENSPILNDILDARTGEPIQRNYKQSHGAPAQTDWFDKEGNVVRRKHWDGRIEKSK